MCKYTCPACTKSANDTCLGKYILGLKTKPNLAQQVKALLLTGGPQCPEFDPLIPTRQQERTEGDLVCPLTSMGA